MRPRKTRRLTLAKETVRSLSAVQLSRAGGGLDNGWNTVTLGTTFDLVRCTDMYTEGRNCPTGGGFSCDGYPSCECS